MRDLSFTEINNTVTTVLHKNGFKDALGIEINFELKNSELVNDSCRISIYQRERGRDEFLIKHYIWIHCKEDIAIQLQKSIDKVNNNN